MDIGYLDADYEEREVGVGEDAVGQAGVEEACKYVFASGLRQWDTQIRFEWAKEAVVALAQA